jgi:hypothetical protein
MVRVQGSTSHLVSMLRRGSYLFEDDITTCRIKSKCCYPILMLSISNVVVNIIGTEDNDQNTQILGRCDLAQIGADF